MTPARGDNTTRPARIVRAAVQVPAELTVRCSHVGLGDEPEAPCSVTCFAPVGAETLAAASVRVAQGGPRQVRLERSDCSACPLAVDAGGERVDVAAQLASRVHEAEQILERSGAGGPDLFEVRVPEPLPGRDSRSDPQGQGRLSRRKDRGWLSRRKDRLRHERRARDTGGPGVGVSRRGLLFGVEREREKESEGISVPAVTEERGVLLSALPNAVVKHPVATQGCTGCRICENVCPEEAILWSGTPGHGLLGVVPADCTACGLCVQTCPEDVLSLDAIAPADAPVHYLTRVQPPGCAKCARPLGPGEAGECTTCTSRRGIIDDVWAQLR